LKVVAVQTKMALEEAGQEIAGSFSRIPECSAVIGFDAFVDESLRIVEQRLSPERFEPIATIGDYGSWVSAAAGRSGLREFVCDEVMAGGCAVNMGDGLTAFGVPLDAFLGIGEVPHGVFAPLLAKCSSVQNVGLEPGRAIVTEFKDGKLMLCGFSHFAEFTPDHLVRHLDGGTFRAACERAQGIALTSWSVYPYMTDCWKHLQSHTLCGLTHHPRFFFDLADPASRTMQDLVAMTEALGGFESIGPTTLSINGNEAVQIAGALGLEAGAADLENSPGLARALREAIGIDEVCIHLIRGAATATVSDVCVLEGPYTPHPRKSVGAGDRFNAGFFLGSLLGLSAHGRLVLGCATSGFFVRHARSGTALEVLDFLDAWSAKPSVEDF
jgi:hypothetical protein